jgi:transcriptional regulator MraZ
LPFQGNHDHSLDAKNRLTVPARSRPELAAGVTLAKGFDPCLQVWPTADYDRVAGLALAGLNPMAPEARELKRHLYGNSMTMELDSAGRIMIPPNFLQYAGISKEVMVVGAGECLELWDRDRWQTYETDLVTRAADHIASVGHPA